MPTQHRPPSPALIVACLCADWCGTCREYRPLFTQVQQEFPDIRFVWIDIEDQADLVDPIEVDNFPTLLIAQHDTPHFFGVITPHIDTLRRLIQTHREPNPRPVAHADQLRHLLRGLVHA